MRTIKHIHTHTHTSVYAFTLVQRSIHTANELY